MVRRALSGFVASLSMVGVLGVAAVVALAVLAAPAFAARGHVFGGSFGGEGEGAGQLKEPAGIAVNESQRRRGGGSEKRSQRRSQSDFSLNRNPTVCQTRSVRSRGNADRLRQRDAGKWLGV
jgi:hypothetical protein